MDCLLKQDASHELPLRLAPGLHVAQHRYDYSEATLLALKRDVELPARLHGAVTRRQIDFLAGRHCARQALQTAGFLDPAPIAIGEHGEPQWPTGFIGSITHCHGWAMAAVSRAARISCVGIDMEELMSVEVARSIASQIATPTETAYLEQQPAPFEATLTLLFSAKESLFKALYPSIRRYFDFLDVQVVALNIDVGCMVLRLSNRLSSQHERGTRYTVAFAWLKNRVITYCSLNAGQAKETRSIT